MTPKKSNDPAGTRPPQAPAPVAPAQLRDFESKLAILRANGVASYRGSDGETINFWPDAPTPVDEGAQEAQREDMIARNREADEQRRTAAAGGMQPRPAGSGRVFTAAERARFPPR